MEKLPYDYIRGLIEGEGCFTFCNKPPQQVLSDGRIVKTQMPAFVLRMHERDEELLKALKNTLGLKDSIHKYYYPNHFFRRPYKIGKQVVIMVREVLELRDIIIPLFYKKLYGHKKLQFFNWLNKMQNEEMTTEAHYLYLLYKKGFFEEMSKKFL